MKQIDVKIDRWNIHIPIQVEPEIHITVPFDLTKGELVYMMEMVSDKKEARVTRVARYYFSVKMSVSEIADQLGLAKKTIYQDINEARQKLLVQIKKDLKANKKVLGHMVDLLIQIEHQTRILWDKYHKLEADGNTFRTIVRRLEDQIKANPNTNIAIPSSTVEAAKVVLSIHDRQMMCLKLLDDKVSRTLQVWDKFGLTGDEAVKVILSGGVDVEVQITELRQTMVNMVAVVKQEVTDMGVRKRVFGKLAKMMAVKAYERKELN